MPGTRRPVTMSWLVGALIIVENAENEKDFGLAKGDDQPAANSIAGAISRGASGSLALGVDPVTGPPVLTWMTHHRGADRIELDIALAREQVWLGIDETGAKTPFPTCAAAAPGSGSHVSNIALTQMLHQQRAAVGTLA